MFAYCSNNPVMFSDPSGCGKLWDLITKFLGIESSTSVTNKLPRSYRGSEWTASISGGKFQTVSTPNASDKEVSITGNVDTCDGETSFQLGLQSDVCTSALTASSEELGILFSSNTEKLSGSIEYTRAVGKATLTFSSYTSVENNITMGTYTSYSVNTITMKTAVAVTVLCAIYAPGALAAAAFWGSSIVSGCPA